MTLSIRTPFALGHSSLVSASPLQSIGHTIQQALGRFATRFGPTDPDASRDAYLAEASGAEDVERRAAAWERSAEMRYSMLIAL